MSRWIKRTIFTVTLLLGIGGGASWWAVEQTHYVPEFYAQATRQVPAQDFDPKRLREDLRKIKANAAATGSWQASFRTNEINSWLIEELPKKFPQLLAKGASEPRIAIKENRVLAAVRYKNRRIDTVVSCELEVEVTEQPNMLALRVQHLRAGALPLPLSKLVKGISKEAAKGDIDIRWDATESGPVALVTIPSEHPRYVSSPVIVESVELADDGLVLSGQAGPHARETFKPNGPVYRFVSYRPGANRSRQTALSTKRKRLSGKLR